MSALDELRENLREAAQRDIAARRVRRRRQRRATGLIVAALIGGGAVATAADLISVGDPVPKFPGQTDRYKPSTDAKRPTILATAESGRTLKYAIGVYDTDEGKRCVVAGSLRGGYTLGREREGTFHPYTLPPAICAAPDKPNGDTWLDAGNVVVYGRAPAAKPGVRVTVDGETVTPPMHADRAFIVVFNNARRNTADLEYFVP